MPPDPPSRIGLPLILFATVLVVLVNLGALGGWNTALLDGRLVDADSYLRMIRVMDLRDGSPWFEDLTQRFAAPEGLVIQWTRPLDILILLPGLALERLGGFAPRDALWIAGIAISPVMHLGAALAAAWGAQAVWPGRAPWYAVLLMVGSPSAATYAVLGRPDHHALIILLLALGLGATLRAMKPGGSGRAAVAAGIAFGIGIWVGPEALIVTAPALIAIGLAALIADDGSVAAAQGRRLCLAMAGSFAFAVLVEHRPEEWLVAEYDRISIQQLCFALLAAAIFVVTEQVGAAPRGRRIAVAGLTAMLAVLLLVLAFPGFLRGPLANADPAYLRLLHPFIQENLPLPPFGPGSLLDVALYVGGAVVAGLIAMAMAAPGWRRDGTWPAGLVLLLTLLTALAGTIGARRFGMDLAPPAAIAGAGLVGLLLAASWPRGVLARALLALVLVVGTLAVPFLGLLSGHAAPAGTAAAGATGRCGWTAMGRWLGAEHPLVDPGGSAPLLMASDIFEGPELVWRTPYRVVATPHHRAGRAIEDSVTVLTGTDAEAAHRVLLRRQVALLLVCTAPPEPPPAGSVAAAVAAGQAPAWLRPIPLPGTLAAFRLFAVQ